MEPQTVVVVVGQVIGTATMTGAFFYWGGKVDAVLKSYHDRIARIEQRHDAIDIRRHEHER